MREFKEGWTTRACEKCGLDKFHDQSGNQTIKYEKINTTERNNVEVLKVTCASCGFTYAMEPKTHGG